MTTFWNKCLAIALTTTLLTSYAEAKHQPNLKPNLPWQIEENNILKFKYIIINSNPQSFDPKSVEKIAETVERYVCKYVYPNWQVSVEIETFVPQTNTDALNLGSYSNPEPTTGTYIPIYLIDEFNSDIANDFATAIHGNVSGSVMNGPDAITYLPPYTGSLLVPPIATLWNPLPFGTPFIIIPSGSQATGNGINAAVARNTADPSLGPTSFEQVFALTLSHEVIETLINPTGTLYTGGGDPTGDAGNQFFYLHEAVDPFSIGTDNILYYHGFAMTNFAFPAYFFPYNNSGKYDLLGNASAPFTPYKGSQFFLYQEKLTPDGSVVTDLEAGAYVSDPSNPETVSFVLNGSIYSYTGWGLKQMAGDPSKLAGINSGVQPRRQQLDLKSAMTKAKSVKVLDLSQRSKKKVSTDPHLLPFQYMDKQGVVTTRFKIINYIPDLLPPEQIDEAIPAMEEYVNTRFYSYWNRKVSIENYTAPNLPEFDGSFIPFFYVNSSQANLDPEAIGWILLLGGFDNLNNVPNALAGPEISQYLIDAPNLPIGNPYMISSDVNFNGTVLPPNVLPPFQYFTAGTTHEIMELIIDPTYADYYATSNPPEDLAILFSQFEECDSVETLGVTQTTHGQSYAMSSFLLPSYFDAYLNNSVYDETGMIYRALYPICRAQIVFQAVGGPLQVGWTLNALEGGTPDLVLSNFGNIFNPATFQAGAPAPSIANPVISPVPSSPLAPIYLRLSTPQIPFTE